jgi:hypothetical protein
VEKKGKGRRIAIPLQDFDSRPLIGVVSREFDDVLAFLERFQVGPAMEKEPIPPSDMRERLERFADGLCDEREREELCEALRADPALVRWVADRVKERRKAG